MISFLKFLYKIKTREGLISKVNDINSDLTNDKKRIAISNPTSMHDIWSALADSSWWAKDAMRILFISDANKVISSANGNWLGVVSVYNGNITGILVNHWTGKAVTLTAATYKEDDITFTPL